MPNLLVMVLNKPEPQNEIMQVFKQIGVKGATIIESMGMGRARAENRLTPLIAGLMKAMDTGHHYNRTIFCVIEDDEVLARAVEEADRLVDFSHPGSGIIFTIPVNLVRGMSTGRKE